MRESPSSIQVNSTLKAPASSHFLVAVQAAETSSHDPSDQHLGRREDLAQGTQQQSASWQHVHDTGGTSSASSANADIDSGSDAASERDDMDDESDMVSEASLYHHLGHATTKRYGNGSSSSGISQHVRNASLKTASLSHDDSGPTAPTVPELAPERSATSSPAR
jgi:hypothetical protein